MECNKLKELALKATPGPWWTWSDGVYSGNPEIYTPRMIRGHHIIICEGLKDIDGEYDTSGNQAFIAAANPSAVLELIAQRDELLAAIEGYLPYMPKSTAKNGGASGHSEMLKASDRLKDAFAKYEVQS